MNTQSLHAHCPVCKLMIPLATRIEIEETITCPDCQTNLIVEKIVGQKVTLIEAGDTEEGASE